MNNGGDFASLVLDEGTSLRLSVFRGRCFARPENEGTSLRLSWMKGRRFARPG